MPLSDRRKEAGPDASVEATAAALIARGEHDEPFRILGLQEAEGRLVVRAFVPGAGSVDVLDDKTGRPLVALQPVPEAHGVFAAIVPRRRKRFGYRLRAKFGGTEFEFHDPYSFGPVLGEIDEYLIGEGSHWRLWDVFGAHCIEHEGVAGTHFCVWAPNAKRVSVVGDFNHWDGRRHVMRRRGVTGAWEIFIPGLGEGASYKYEIVAQSGTVLPLKADPVAFAAEHPPATASVVRRLSERQWRDEAWMSQRSQSLKADQPISIYEVHPGSWRRVPEDGDRMLSYRELAEQLVPYAGDMGFTHIELLPISEFPFDGSWGYQPIGLYAPTVRHGTLEEFREFVETCHLAGLGLILDWVPGHFPTDAHGLGRFDGTALYEHQDPREGFQPDWNTLVYNYGRREVANYLIANALYWLEEHHVDGLRVDAVASMLYRDYSRADGEWVPNVYGGRENLEAIDFLRRLNDTVNARVPGAAMFAEESTAWPGVSRPTDRDGLGFGYKWNMGWMNDTLEYMRHDPVHRKYHHHQLTFSITYAFSENFVLPLSHDEVVHGKGSLLAKMPGSGSDQFANLRAYYAFMWAHPGKKLMFMGGEFAQGREWNHNTSLDWHLLDIEWHSGVQSLVRDLNGVYRRTAALHTRDSDPGGFCWIEANAADESLYAFARFGGPDDAPVVVVSNFTPVVRDGWRVGLPVGGQWNEIINTNSMVYGGNDVGRNGIVESEPVEWQGQAQSAVITIPPLSSLILQPQLAHDMHGNEVKES